MMVNLPFNFKKNAVDRYHIRFKESQLKQMNKYTQFLYQLEIMCAFLFPDLKRTN